MERSKVILAAEPVTNSHETSANVAKVAVRLPITTLPKKGVEVLEKDIPSQRNNRPSLTNCWTWNTNLVNSAHSEQPASSSHCAWAGKPLNLQFTTLVWKLLPLWGDPESFPDETSLFQGELKCFSRWIQSSWNVSIQHIVPSPKAILASSFYSILQNWIALMGYIHLASLWY